MHVPTSTTRGADHWTLLMLDNEEGEWRFYNFIRPRNNNMDPYLQDAHYLVISSNSNLYIPISKAICYSNPIQLTCRQKKAFAKTMRHYDMLLPCEEPIVEIHNTPQQRNTSVNCGVAILYLIRQHFHQAPISKEAGEQALPNMRAEIISTLLTWGKGKEHYTDMLLRRRQFT